MMKFPGGSDLAELWNLDRDIVFLNHGSFGACPMEVMEQREALLRRAERDPMKFLLNDLEPMLEETHARLEDFTGAQRGSIVMVKNATTAVNTILHNLPAGPGDTVLVTDQEYFSSANSLETFASRRGFKLKVVELPWPVREVSEVLQAFEDAAVPGARYALLDHIVSPTGAVLPLREIIALLSRRGIGSVVDGAHGPGQVPLDLAGLGCLAYTGNCHKWMFTPRASALLYVRPDFQPGFKPLVVSHLPGKLDSPLSDLQVYFRWNGTPDPTPELCVPFAIRRMGALLDGGWESIMERNRNLALEAREIICGALGLEPSCPESMVGAMAAVPLEGSSEPSAGIDPLQKELRDSFGIVVPVTDIRGGTVRMLRISAQLYNSPEQYHYLAKALKLLLHR